jgi:predicted metal-dependent TIM-barrel fold hydrolase
MEALSASKIDPGRILIDHVEEHTVAEVLDRGFWAGMTLYPDTKMTPQRASDVIEMYGSERIWMNSAGDWGCSDPLAVPKARIEMSRRGHQMSLIDKVTLDNPQTFLSQSEKFVLKAE